MLGQRDQHQRSGTGIARVAADDRDIRFEVQGGPHFLRIVVVRPVELVDRHDERGAAPLEEVERREAVLQPPGVGQDHRAERAVGQLVPHEPEAVLAGRAEQVQDMPLIERDASEVEGDGRRLLLPQAGQIVGADAGRGDGLLGAERLDLAHGADECGLADPEPSCDEQFDGSGQGVRWLCRRLVRVAVVGH